MRHHTKDKGDLAVGQVIADLLRQGIQVLLPIPEHLPFDLAAVSPSNRDLRTVQVRYATAKNGAVKLSLRNSYSDRHGVHHRRVRPDDVDVFAVFCPETNTVYYIRRDEVPVAYRTDFALRLTPAKNGQVAKTRPAANFEGAGRIFGPVAQ